MTPAISVSEVDRSGSAATATLDVSWTFPGVPQKWTYTSTAQLQNDAGRWKTAWQASIVDPQLNGVNRLSQRRVAADRGEMLGEDGDVIVKLRPVVRIGIDKSAVDGEAAATAATELAKLSRSTPRRTRPRSRPPDPRRSWRRSSFRATDDDRPANPEVFAIPGALPIEDEQMLAPTRDFARPILGIVGEATKEIVDASDGAVVAGDEVGLSGLQKRYDDQLRGTPGVQVRLLPLHQVPRRRRRRRWILLRSDFPASVERPEHSASPAAAGHGVRGQAGGRQGSAATLNVDLQKLAEKTLAATKPASAIVAIRPSTGAVLAAANGAGNKGQSSPRSARPRPARRSRWSRLSPCCGPG